jgi:uncharacterized glyoxalase superfamily protein PhnB
VRSAQEEAIMEQRLNIITVLVQDLEKALTFYRDGLGWQPWWPTAETTEEVDHAAFALQGALSFVLYPRPASSANQHVTRSPLIELAQFVNTKAAVDATLQQAVAAGATVVQQPITRDWGGYTAKFADLDGCHWEITWNPQYATEDIGATESTEVTEVSL